MSDALGCGIECPQLLRKNICRQSTGPHLVSFEPASRFDGAHSRERLHNLSHLRKKKWLRLFEQLSLFISGLRAGCQRCRVVHGGRPASKIMQLGNHKAAGRQYPQTALKLFTAGVHKPQPGHRNPRRASAECVMNQSTPHPNCPQAFSSRFTLTGCGVRSSCAKKLTRSSSSSHLNSCMRSSLTPLRSATRRQ